MSLMFIKKATSLIISNSFLKVENGLEKIDIILDEKFIGEFVLSTRIAICQLVGEH
jgi:hypothetical protein